MLLVGGFGSGGDLSSAELYDPKTQAFTATGSMSEGREDFDIATIPAEFWSVDGPIHRQKCISTRLAHSFRSAK